MTVSLDDIIARAADAERVAGKHNPSHVASDDQDRAAIRELAAECGLDLDNRGTAAQVMRVLELIRRTGHYLADEYDARNYLYHLARSGPEGMVNAALVMCAGAQVNHTALHALTDRSR